MGQDNGTCHTLCHSQVPPEDAKFINERIREDYALNWLVDGLPAAEMKVDSKTAELFFDMGFNLGNDEGTYEDTPALNNHYDIVLKSETLSNATTPADCILCAGTTNHDRMFTASSASLYGPRGELYPA